MLIFEFIFHDTSSVFAFIHLLQENSLACVISFNFSNQEQHVYIKPDLLLVMKRSPKIVSRDLILYITSKQEGTISL